MLTTVFKVINKINIKANVLRSLYYSKLFKCCGSQLRIYGSVNIKNPHNISAGENVAINDGAYINAHYPIIIGDNVAISAGAIIVSTGLDAKSLSIGKHYGKEINIKDNVQIGAGAIILPGAIINQNTIIGAGAIITKEMPGDSIIAGVPGKVVRKIYG